MEEFLCCAVATGWLVIWIQAALLKRKNLIERTRAPDTQEGTTWEERVPWELERMTAMGIHHRCVKMLVSSECSVGGHAHGCGLGSVLGSVLHLICGDSRLEKALAAIPT